MDFDSFTRIVGPLGRSSGGLDKAFELVRPYDGLHHAFGHEMRVSVVLLDDGTLVWVAETPLFGGSGAFGKGHWIYEMFEEYGKGDYETSLAYTALYELTREFMEEVREKHGMLEEFEESYKDGKPVIFH